MLGCQAASVWVQGTNLLRVAPVTVAPWKVWSVSGSRDQEGQLPPSCSEGREPGRFSLRPVSFPASLGGW